MTFTRTESIRPRRRLVPLQRGMLARQSIRIGSSPRTNLPGIHTASASLNWFAPWRRQEKMMQISAVQRQPESYCENPAEDPLCNSIYKNRREFTHQLISQVQVNIPVAKKTFISNERHSTVNADDLSNRWNISLAQAQQTLKVTTQRGIRSAALPLSSQALVQSQSDL